MVACYFFAAAMGCWPATIMSGLYRKGAVLESLPHFLEELALSNMWGIAALVEVLERKGLLTRDEIREAMHALQERHTERADVERQSGALPINAEERTRKALRTLSPKI